MKTAVLEQEIVTTPLKHAVSTIPVVTPLVKKERSITFALTFLIGCVALMMTGFAIIMPVFPQRLQAMGLGAETLALMEAAFGLGMFLFSTPMGTWSGRIGRKPILFISLAGYIVTNLLLAWVSNAFLFVVVRFVEGMVISGMMPAVMAMVGDTIPVEQQGRWIGAITTAQAVGIAVGPALGGLLSQTMGLSSPFLFTAGLALIAAVLSVIMVPETLPKQVKGEANRHKATAGSRADKPKRMSLVKLTVLFAPLLLIDFGVIFTYPFVFPQYPFFLEKVLHYSTAQYGLVISSFGLALAIFPFLLGRLSETMPKRTMIVLGSLLFGVLNLVMFTIPLYPLLLTAAVLSGLGDALITPAMGGLFLAATTDENRGQVMGMRGSAISLAVMLGPLAQAGIGPWISSQTTFAIGFALSLIMVVIAFLVLRPPQQAQEER